MNDLTPGSPSAPGRPEQISGAWARRGPWQDPRGPSEELAEDGGDGVNDNLADACLLDDTGRVMEDARVSRPTTCRSALGAARSSAAGQGTLE